MRSKSAGSTTPHDLICQAWGYTYDAYRWSYLVEGPRSAASFGPDASLKSNNDIAAHGVTMVDPDTVDTVPPQTLEGAAPPEPAPQVDFEPDEDLPSDPWAASLEYPLRQLEKLVDCTKSRQDGLGKFVRLCAWQAANCVKDARRIPERCQPLLERLGSHARQPTILRRVSDRTASLRIPGEAFPTYTLQMTVNLHFTKLASELLVEKETDASRARQARLICPGPVILEPSSAQQFAYLFPLREEARNAVVSWQPRDWQAGYRVDRSATDSALRLDFTLDEPHGAKRASLLVQDRGYFLMRKKAGYVDATEIVVERSLWFANGAYTMNATLMPLFRMMVESRVLRELARMVYPTKGSSESRVPERKA